MGQQRFLNLDAMRGICALSVVLFHCDGLFVHGEIFCHGFLAVDMFFLLSGFVIAHTYEQRLADGMTAAVFAQLRLKRLAPVYWVGTLLGAVMLVAVASYRPAGMFYSPVQIAGLAAMAMVLVPQLTMPAFGGLAYPANAVAWSLAGELVVNLLYARWLNTWSLRRLMGLVAATWAGCAIVGYLNPLGWCFGAFTGSVLLTPLRAVPAFLMGVALFRLHRCGKFVRVPRISPLLPLLAWVTIAQVPTFGATPTYDMILVTLLCPLLLVLMVRAPETAPKPLLWLGAISYPLYASHLAIVFTARSTPLFGLDHGPDASRAVIMLAVALALAWAIHYFVEQPRPHRQVLRTPA